MSQNSLEDAIKAAGNPVTLLRNAQTGPYVYPVVPPEFTNWRDEQRAWQETCVLFDQSYHMTDMTIEGPDTMRVLSDLGINSFKTFGPNKAKQYVATSHDGYVIGDGILFCLEENLANLVGRPSVHNWVRYHCETAGYDASCEVDERAAAQQGPIRRKTYRYQVQGPTALQVIEKAIGKPVPKVKFFNMDVLQIAGKQARALRHGMVGQPGLEVMGPWEEGDAVKAALIEAGEEFGMRQAGARVYSSNTLESGWIPSPMPAVYTGDPMKAYREWLPAKGYEGTASLGGSFVSEDIQDYYLTPYDLGYGPSVKFDHDFVGREALERHAKNPKRKKVTLVLNGDDVTRAIGTMFQPDNRAKYFDFPSAVYSTLPYDRVVRDGRTVGVSTWCGYSANEGKMLTLAMLENEHSETGTPVTLVWGEEGGGTSKPTVERHVQTEIRATVAPAPYVEIVRAAYRAN